MPGAALHKQSSKYKTFRRKEKKSTHVFATVKEIRGSIIRGQSAHEFATGQYEIGYRGVSTKT